jgi:hypothetical protein
MNKDWKASHVERNMNCIIKNKKMKVRSKEELHEQTSKELHMQKNIEENCPIKNRKMKLRNKEELHE